MANIASWCFELFMNELGIDTSNSPHLQDTPERVARAYRDFLAVGLEGSGPNLFFLMENRYQWGTMTWK